MIGNIRGGDKTSRHVLWSMVISFSLKYSNYMLSVLEITLGLPSSFFDRIALPVY